MPKLRALAIRPCAPKSLEDNPRGAALEIGVETQFLRNSDTLSASKGALPARVERVFGKDSMGRSRPQRSDPGDVSDLVRRIVEKVNNYNPERIKGWDALRSKTSNARLFRIESNPRVFLIGANGKFDGRAEVLVHIPQVLPSGRSYIGSMAVPARVVGHVGSDNEITIDEIALNE